MSNLYNVKISDLSSITNVLNKRIMHDDIVLLTDKSSNYKSKVNDLSTVVEKNLLKVDDLSVYGKWTFKNKVYLSNSYTKEDVYRLVDTDPMLGINKETVDFLYDFTMKKLAELSVDIYNKPRLPSYPGMTVVTSISTSEQMIKTYGGVWYKAYSGYFIAGASKTLNDYSIDKIYNVGNISVLLTPSQAPKKSHSHSVSGISGKSSEVAYVSYVPFAPGSHNFGRHGGKKFASNIVGPFNTGCSTSVTVTIESDSSQTSKIAESLFDNRPQFQCLYIWKRLI